MEIVNPQNYAIQIEGPMRKAFGYDRSEVGGLVNSDYIRQHPFTALMCTLAFLCKSDDDYDVDAVSNFFERFQCYEGMSIDQLLDSENNCKVISGEDIPQTMIDGFYEACAQMKQLSVESSNE